MPKQSPGTHAGQGRCTSSGGSPNSPGAWYRAGCRHVLVATRSSPSARLGALIPLSQHHLAQLGWKGVINARFGEMLPGSTGCLFLLLGVSGSWRCSAPRMPCPGGGWGLLGEEGLLPQSSTLRLLSLSCPKRSTAQQGGSHPSFLILLLGSVLEHPSSQTSPPWHRAP